MISWKLKSKPLSFTGVVPNFARWRGLPGASVGVPSILLAVAAVAAVTGFFIVRAWAAANNWTSLATSPAQPGNGLALAGAGSDTLFALRGGNTTNFYRYRISADTWDEMAPVPGTVDRGGALVLAGSDTLFATRGNNTANLYRYRISANAWDTMADMPVTIFNGGNLVLGGSDTLFALRGGNTTNFYRYLISADAWDTMANAPGSTGSGDGLAQTGSDTLFALRGNRRDHLYRYLISTNTWGAANSVPTGGDDIDAGAGLVYPGSGAFLYAFLGTDHPNSLYRYSISAGAWTQMANAPVNFSVEGGALAYPGTGNVIYAWNSILGRMYRYSISNALPDTPTSLGQSRLDGASVAVGGVLTDTTSIRLQVRASDPDGDTFSIQVELRPAGTAFTSPVNVTIDTTVFFQSGWSASSAAETLTITVDTLAAGSYHWQARVVDFVGDSTGWVAFNAAGTHFTIGAAADTSLPVSYVTTSTSGTAVVNPPVATSDTFVQVNLSGGGVTTGGAATLLAVSDSVGTGADYLCTFTLVAGADTVYMPIWTNQTSTRIFIGLRTDTWALDTATLPITNSDAGRRAFGATIVSLEFADSAGRMIGDSVSTQYIGDSFTYSIVYYLSAATAAAFNAVGIDTGVGSTGFRFYYADTYGGKWTEDTTCTVMVVNQTTNPWSIVVRVTGITKDLPGGLGGAGGGAALVGKHHRCIIAMSASHGFLSDGIVAMLRSLRDMLLAFGSGRAFAAIYYLLCA